MEFCSAHKIQLIAYRPLGKGEMLNDPVFRQVGDKYSKTSAQVILRWNFQKNIPTLVKTNSKEYSEENLEIFDFVLNQDDMQLLDGLNRDKRFCIPKWADFDY